MLESNISSLKSCSTVYKLCDLGCPYYKKMRLIQLLHHEVVKMETTWVKSLTQRLCNHSCYSPNISDSPFRHTIELYLPNLKLGVAVWLALANGTQGNLIWHCWSYKGGVQPVTSPLLYWEDRGNMGHDWASVNLDPGSLWGAEAAWWPQWTGTVSKGTNFCCVKPPAFWGHLL